MNRIRPALHGILTAIHPQVYFLRAPKDAEFPYLVYDLPNSFWDAEQEIWSLDVDVWDIAEDTTVLEGLARQVSDTLHRLRYMDADIVFKVYRINRLALDDDDDRIRRRKVMFELRAFDSGLIKRTGE